MRSRVSILLGAAVLVLVLAWSTWWLLGRTAADDGAGIANVFALAPGVLSAVAAMVALRRGVDGSRHPGAIAGRLLGAVSQDEARVLARLLGDTGEVKPANAGFEQMDAALVRWRSDGGEHGGSLSTVSPYYRQLTRGRLVVLGEAGAGKTVLALSLLLDLALRARATLDDNPTARIRVPVRMNLSGFTFRGDGDPEAVRRHLVGWMAKYLSQVYGVRARAAKALVADRWILPILDGLDEMDLDGDPPTRAREVLAALNLPVGPVPDAVVITCRTSRYHALAEKETLEDATAVVMRPLDVEDVIAWLRHRFPDASNASGIEGRWQPVVQRLRRHPGGRLARCLGNPLHLYLAVTVYRDRVNTPRDLVRLDADQLDIHLMSRLVPTTVAHHARPGGGHYAPDDVRRWLRTLSRHLASTAAQGLSSTDLHVHDLWRSAKDVTGMRTRLAATLLTLTVLAPPVIWYLSRQVFHTPPTWVDWGNLLMVSAAVVFAVTWSTTHAGDPPARITVRALHRRLPQLLILAAVATMAYAAFSVIEGVVRDGPSGVFPAFDAATEAAFSVWGATLTVWLVMMSNQVQDAVARPGALMRGALHHDMYLLVVLTIGLSISLRGDDAIPTAVLVSACAIAATSAWPRYVITLIAYCRRGLLPWRLGHFLDWAHAVGILRVTGTGIQFRHRDLQRHLVA